VTEGKRRRGRDRREQTKKRNIGGEPYKRQMERERGEQLDRKKQRGEKERKRQRGRDREERHKRRHIRGDTLKRQRDRNRENR
jgi:hypothetical protein